MPILAYVNLNVVSKMQYSEVVKKKEGNLLQKSAVKIYRFL
ncbi:unknown [[Mannheimia] succiniciproducens MBEL55E]|uniref:Uncharacterized protein n=1 Tax=Mannheimia succiniciproducens (strain KCTC 0769BP / MBEL55E) TaxID=221988 RepID=Q65U72_MANSM|nr:unknown [[Mannheimia] succiniciproducens MBEL55E]